MDITTAAVVLAAGEGKRMVSDTPQVLHKVADTPLICHAVGKMLEGGWAPVVVVVSPQNREAVKEALKGSFPEVEITYREQSEAEGVLHAAGVGLEGLGEFEGNVMVVPANMPLLQAETTLLCLEAMIAEGAAGSQAPYVGLVQRGAQRHLPVFCSARAWLQQALAAVTGRLADGDSSASEWIRELQQAQPGVGPDVDEHTLASLAGAGFAVNAASEGDLCVVATRADLAVAEKLLKLRLIAHHQAQGVTFRDPEGTFLGSEVTMEKDVTIGAGVQIYGKTTIGRGARIEGPTTVTNSTIGAGVHIRSFSVVEGAVIEEGSGAGPFARLREGTHLGPSSYLGNFVETKNAKIGRNTLACHLTYLGDAEVGSRTNIGAGTITCNFNGASKNTTTIGDDAFVGSNSTLVAPVRVGSGAVVAAGSTLTDSVSEGSLAFGRARQVVKEGKAQELKAKLKEQAKQGA